MLFNIDPFTEGQERSVAVMTVHTNITIKIFSTQKYWDTMKHYQNYKTGFTYGADTVRQYRDKTEVPGDDVNMSLEWQFKKKKKTPL